MDFFLRLQIIKTFSVSTNTLQASRSSAPSILVVPRFSKFLFTLSNQRCEVYFLVFFPLDLRLGPYILLCPLLAIHSLPTPFY